MNKWNLVFAATCALALTLLSPTQAQAKGIPIFYSTGSEKIAKVADFPQTELFTDATGAHFDAGIMYKQVSLMFVPLWNYDVQWCGMVDEDTYVQITKEQLDEIAKTAGITLPESGKVPMWDAFGGKAIVAVLLAGLAFFLLSGNKDDKDDEDADSEKEDKAVEPA